MIVEEGWAGRVMTWLRAVSALVVVNLLFVAGTVLGLVVGGIMPAAAASAVCLTRLRDGQGAGLVRLFIVEYRARFVRANLLGLPFAAVALLLAADTAVLPLLPGSASAMLAVFTWVVGAYALIVLAAALAIDVRYRDRLGATLRFAATLPLASPVMTLALAATLGVIGASLLALPMLLPLIGVSAPLFVAGWFVDHRLAQLDPAHPRAVALATA